jgi:hypothetical protein
MQPRLAYKTDLEQIDGSLAFDSDDYIVEANWIAETVSRETADALAAKVRRKGKNALGLIVAVNGFSGPALRAHAEETPFLTTDGGLVVDLGKSARVNSKLISSWPQTQTNVG